MFAYRWHIGVESFNPFVMYGTMSCTIRSFIEHDQVISNNLGSKLFVSFFVFPASCSQAALDIYQAAFVKIFLGELGKSAPQYYGMPFSLRDQFTCPVFESFGSGEGKLRNCNIPFKMLY